MQRKRELKFYATNTHQFPLILDAWLPVERRPRGQIFFFGREHKTKQQSFEEEVSEQTELSKKRTAFATQSSRF